jgi:LysM repeat protein
MKLPKLPTFLAMKPRKKLHATATARRAQQIPDNYDEDEPHTRLSSAFVVVLILHVVAVGGIYAFNSIRSHRKLPEAAPALATGSKAQATDPVAPPAATGSRNDDRGAAHLAPTTSLPTTPAPQPLPAGARTHRVVAGENLTKIAQQHNVTVAEIEAANGAKSVATLQIGQVLVIPKASATAAKNEAPPKVGASGTKATSKTYVVAKGDNVVAIAKKFGVSSTELLKLNNIDDPKKLQIGQTLKVPPKK